MIKLKRGIQRFSHYSQQDHTNKGREDVEEKALTILSGAFPDRLHVAIREIYIYELVEGLPLQIPGRSKMLHRPYQQPRETL